MATGSALASVDFGPPAVNFGGGGKPSQSRFRSSKTPWNFSLIPGTFLHRERAHPNRASPPSAALVALENIKAAVDNPGIRICSKRGSCDFEQGGERDSGARTSESLRERRVTGGCDYE